MVKSNATETKQPKSIAYIRVSSQRQVDEGVSLDAQKRRIEQLAEFKGLNLDPDDILIEQGVSAGIPLWERPKGRTLRRKLRSGDYENLIVMRLDRLFRITSDMLLTVEELDDMGIRLHIADLGGEPIDSSTTMGRFMLTIFGWDVDEDGMLVPNWDEQDTIDWMEWQVNNNGMLASAVARSLNGQGIKGKRGGDWQSHSVSRIIANEFHANRVEFEHPDAWGSMPWHRIADGD